MLEKIVNDILKDSCESKHQQFIKQYMIDEKFMALLLNFYLAFDSYILVHQNIFITRLETTNLWWLVWWPEIEDVIGQV